jgi:uncharacterized protein (TIGR03067 family)
MMLRNAFALATVLGVVIAPTLADSPKELSGEAKRALKALEGKWQAVKFLHADRETTPDALVVEFKGDTIDFAGAATGVVVTLDPATEPKCLDFKVRVGSGLLKQGSTYESVYQRDGDSLTWAFYHGRGKNRPTAFEKPTDPGVIVMVFNRVKE